MCLTFFWWESGGSHGCPAPLGLLGWGSWQQGKLQGASPALPWAEAVRLLAVCQGMWAEMEHFHEPPVWCLCAVSGEWGSLP